jgi:hypothetical protein
MAEVRALVREFVLEEFFAGEVLEIRVVDRPRQTRSRSRSAVRRDDSAFVTLRSSPPGDSIRKL